MFTGTVPGSWSGMLMLQDLELQYNCAVCGALPRFPLQVLFCCSMLQHLLPMPWQLWRCVTSSVHVSLPRNGTFGVAHFEAYMLQKMSSL